MSSGLVAANHPELARSIRHLWDYRHELSDASDLAAAACMSLRSLLASFVEHFALTPGTELRRLRIERATRLLLDSNEKLEAVGEMSGLQGLNSFRYAFRHATGVSPAKFRKLVPPTTSKTEQHRSSLLEIHTLLQKLGWHAASGGS